jgi:hypothetical protein
LPACPRPGHGEHRVVKDGRYGTPSRQRFRCIGPTGFHRFVPELTRHEAHDSVCDTCDTHVPAHRGPVTGRKYDFPVREVATALAAVGAGESYQHAALRARAASGRPLLEGGWGGNTVAEWLDNCAPVVMAEHAETAWPETLVLDSTRFMVTNTWTGAMSLAFNVLGAYGYPAKGYGRPRLWALAAYHRATHVEWEDFLRQLDTSAAPLLVISDGVDEIRNAVRQVWPRAAGTSTPSPFVLRCEHHLRENAREALQADRVDHWGSVRMTALNGAFRSPQGWAAFKATVWPKHANAYQWVQDNDAQVLAQVTARTLLPAHHSTAALDTHLGTVRDYLDSRSFVLRNQRRTTAMLGLVRLHLNGTDIPARYATALRAWLEAHHGTPAAQRTGYDAGTSRQLPAAARQVASLRR